ncbi:MAG TPA: hypothetical protein VLA56_00680 [Pseudomonadales bacterium]|nr:hypothetical protein [Pseudomonadales bacterium]
MHRLHHWLQRRAPRPQGPARLVSMALGADRATGRRMLDASARANRRFQADHARLARSARAAPPPLHWPGATAWTRALQADGRPLILATLHLGSYLSALLALAGPLAWLERVTVFRHERDHPLEPAALAHFARAGLHLELARTREPPARQALRALRSGGHLLLMHDVPPRFDVGRTLEVPFFGRGAHFATGPATLAWRTGALLWPLALPRIDGRLTLRSMTPITVDAPSRIAPATAALAAFAQRCIGEAPEQWLLWPHLDAFWAPSPHATAPRSRGPGATPARARPDPTYT